MVLLSWRGAICTFVAISSLWAASAEEEVKEEAKPATGAEEEEGVDETKRLLDSLTITMAGEVVDERSFEVRATTKEPRKVLRLGNSVIPEQGSMDAEEYKEKLASTQAALSKLINKQMIWWKAAPAEVQPPRSEDDDSQLIVADVWLIDGRHVNSLLKKEGHLVHINDYHTDLAKNILSAEAEEQKKESYKELEKALKESEEAKRRAAKEKAKEKLKEESTEALGLPGWTCLGVLTIIVVGAALNFGREPKKKKVNLNRKRGLFEQFWSKLKVA